MKTRLKATMWIGIITALFTLISTFNITKGAAQKNHTPSTSNDKLKKAALEVLDTKCNACHRKQNPFMVFKEKNISKRAKRIYKAVFIELKMPKGNKTHMTDKEYAALEKWLLTQKIN